MTKDEWYAQLFERLGNSRFRSSFHLKQKDIVYINEKGLDTIRKHAEDFIAKREAPAYIPNDGKQTPIYSTACNCNLLPGMHPKMAQNAAGTGFESGAAGLSRGCDYDMDSKGTGKTIKH